MNGEFKPQPPEEPVFISGYSDASFCDRTKKGGYGIWVRDYKERIIRGGPTPKWVVDANLAELSAVWAAVYTGLTFLDPDAHILVVKTDSQTAAGWMMQRTKRPKSEDAQRIVQKARQLAREKEIRLIVKWVKGHQGVESTVGWLNNRVDKISRRCRHTQKDETRRENVKGESPSGIF